MPEHLILADLLQQNMQLNKQEEGEEEDRNMPKHRKGAQRDT